MSTRAHIIDVAAALMLEKGVAAVSVEDVYREAGASSSQIYHYFGDRQGLIQAVVQHQTAAVIDRQEPVLRSLDSFAALRRWARMQVSIQDEGECVGGSAFGSLAGQLNESAPEARVELSRGFDRWENAMAVGLGRMQMRGELRADADPERLAVALIAALQGGLLLTQTQRTVRPLEIALDTMIQHVESFAASQ